MYRSQTCATYRRFPRALVIPSSSTGWIRNPEYDETAAILWASARGHEGVVKLLSQDGQPDPEAQDNYSIRWASTNGHGALSSHQ
jgi:hypothetical protein